ncbi:MAG: metal-dependent transcriptional regulator [Spirochaetales bacterium]|nr:metal-dependent transcriptional regulator [Spirochaetales bacterium]
MKDDLTPSMEDYLETILLLEQKNRVARVKDIAEKLSVQMPSVTGALKSLRSRELVEYEKNSFINLTPKGMKLAKAIFLKHGILVNFFEKALGLTGEHAEEQACRVEHAIDDETAKRFQNLTEWVEEKSPQQAPGDKTT